MSTQISFEIPRTLCPKWFIEGITAAALIACMAAPLSGQTVVGTITRTGMIPTQVEVYETGNKVCVADMSTGNVYIYNGNTLAESGFVALGFPDLQATGMVVNETYGKLYAIPYQLDLNGKIAVVDVVNHTFVRHIELPSSPKTFMMIAQDEALDKVYVLYVGGFIQIDVATDTVTSVPGIAGNANRRMAVNPVSHEVFISNWMYDELDIVNGVTLAHTQISDMQGLGVGVNWLENKVYVLWGEPLLPKGYWCKVIDRDTNSVTPLAGDNDPTYVRFNPSTNRLYTSAEQMARLGVVSGATDAVRELPLEGATDFAIRYATDRIYYVYLDGITILDGATEMLERIPIAYNSGGGGIVYQDVAVNQATGRVYVINCGAHNNSVTVVQDPEKADRPMVFVSGLNGSSVMLMDSATGTWLSGQLNASPGRAQYGMAFRAGGGRLYLPTINDLYQPYDQSLRVLAGNHTEALIATVGTSGTAPAGVAAKPDGSRVYVTNSGSNNVAVIDPVNQTLITNIAVGLQPWGMAITPDASTLFVANKTGNSVSIIGTSSNTVLKTITVGTSPWGVVVNPSGTKAYVANSGSGTVSVIDIGSQTVIDTVAAGTDPRWLAFSPDGKYLYVSNAASVVVIDAGTDEVQQTVTVPVGSHPPTPDVHPEGIAAHPDGTRVYVAERSRSGLTVPGDQYNLHVIQTADFSVAQMPISITNAMVVAVPDPNSKIAGRITISGAPARGATVRALQGGVEKGSALTNASGDYAIPNLKAGTYDVAVSAPGCAPQTVLAQSVEAGFIKPVSVNLPRAVPDFDGDGRSDIAVRRPATGTWYYLISHTPGSYGGTPWGVQTDVPVIGDYDGDGTTDIAVWSPGSGIWYTLPSKSPGTYTARQWGAPSDEPLPADYDGDGKTDMAVRRPSSGIWYVLPSGSPGAMTETQWGVATDIPVPEDYDGDGADDIAVWRPSNGAWYIRPSSAPGTFISALWGVSTDIPVPGDYDGDGKADIAVWRPSNGIWYVVPSKSPATFSSTQWGLLTDIPVAGDFDGDGKTDIAVYRPSAGIWHILPSGTPGAYTGVQWGQSGDEPISALTGLLRRIP